MVQDPMSIDQSETEATAQQPLRTLTDANGPLASSLSALASSSRTLPTNADFHFYYNFDEFKRQVRQISSASQSLLQSLGSNRVLGHKQDLRFPAANDLDLDLDLDDAQDWLVDLNDEILERFDSSIDEFRKIRKQEEETGVRVGSGLDESGFQVVYGKKNKNKGVIMNSVGDSRADSGVKVAEKKGVVGVKAKVPFHIATIRRPQDEFNILVNNSNQPFEHVWLQKSDDGFRLVHHLEKLSVLDFVDKDIVDVEPVPPPPIESTPFVRVEEVKDLKQLAAKLHGVNEFAVDLEHNQYRSFQGLTCLMQISTRTEDFIVDTLKLRIHVGPYLREVFKDPSKKKVMHGADRDILWLQRDFGIYICNLFDTGQASRVLKLERNSLEYLLHHFCGITANKEYQNADWRLRPLPDEMLKYAREDTHYLLHIYDVMKAMLHKMPSNSESSDTPLVEVYKRSYDVCMQLYEKELLTESSYLHIYGLHDAGFTSQQLAVAAGLFEWRDVVARAEDESTGYILPNKTLLEIAKQMPVTTSKLRRLLKSKHPYVERNLGSVVSIIRQSIQDAAAFEDAAQHLNEGRLATAAQDNIESNDEVLSPGALLKIGTANTETEINLGSSVMESSMSTLQAISSLPQRESTLHGSSVTGLAKVEQGFSFNHHGENGGVRIESNSISELSRESTLFSIQPEEANTYPATSPTVKAAGATVQILKKPTGGFGALLGSSVTKRKLDAGKKEGSDMKLEKIKSSVRLPFHSFGGANETPKAVARETTKVSEASHPEESIAVPTASSTLGDIIPVEDDSDVEAVENEKTETKNAQMDDKSAGSALNEKKEDKEEDEEEEEDDDGVSLSDLSTSFQECFQSRNRNRETSKAEISQEPTGLLQVKPFDFAAARKHIKFGEDPKQQTEAEGGKDDQRNAPDSASRKKNSAVDDGANEFQPGRRRKAFPASGNRSATFRN